MQSVSPILRVDRSAFAERGFLYRVGIAGKHHGASEIEMVEHLSQIAVQLGTGDRRLVPELMTSRCRKCRSMLLIAGENDEVFFHIVHFTFGEPIEDQVVGVENT